MAAIAVGVLVVTGVTTVTLARRAASRTAISHLEEQAPTVTRQLKRLGRGLRARSVTGRPTSGLGQLVTSVLRVNDGTLLTVSDAGRDHRGGDRAGGQRRGRGRRRHGLPPRRAHGLGPRRRPAPVGRDPDRDGRRSGVHRRADPRRTGRDVGARAHREGRRRGDQPCTRVLPDRRRARAPGRRDRLLRARPPSDATARDHGCDRRGHRVGRLHRPRGPRRPSRRRARRPRAVAQRNGGRARERPPDRAAVPPLGLPRPAHPAHVDPGVRDCADRRHDPGLTGAGPRR